MVQNFNTSLLKRANDIFNVKDGNFFQHNTPNFLTPTVNIQETVNLIKSGSATNATSANVYTTPTDKDVYLTSFTFGVIKDASSPSTASWFQCTVNGVLYSLCIIPTLASVAYQTQISQALTTPIKLDRGTGITVVNQSGTANITATLSFQGYISDTLQL